MQMVLTTDRKVLLPLEGFHGSVILIYKVSDLDPNDEH